MKEGSASGFLAFSAASLRRRATGWSIATFFYYPSASASGGKEFFRGDKIVAGVQGRGALVGLGPTYTFATPLFGGQAAVSLLGVGGPREPPRILGGDRSVEGWNAWLTIAFSLAPQKNAERQ